MTLERFKFELAQIDKEQVPAYIENRIHSLNIKSVGDFIDKEHNCEYGRFLGPNLQIASNDASTTPNFVMDDLKIYEDFIKFVGVARQKCLMDELIALTYVDKYIKHYLGEKPDEMWDRAEFYYDSNNVVDGVVPISKMKNQNIALCTERAALAHNLCLFLGIDSNYEIGRLNNVDHAFIVIKSSLGRMYLYDPTNPIYVEAKNLTAYIPAISPMTNEDYLKFLDGSDYEFNYEYLINWVGDFDPSSPMVYHNSKPLLIR